MTLRQFLQNNKIVGISHKEESDLGVIISKKFYDKNNRGATKVKVDYCFTEVNSYAPEFLESCIDDIIGFFSSSTLSRSDTG